MTIRRTVTRRTVVRHPVVQHEIIETIPVVEDATIVVTKETTVPKATIIIREEDVV